MANKADLDHAINLAVASYGIATANLGSTIISNATLSGPLVNHIDRINGNNGSSD